MRLFASELQQDGHRSDAGVKFMCLCVLIFAAFQPKAGSPAGVSFWPSQGLWTIQRAFWGSLQPSDHPHQNKQPYTALLVSSCSCFLFPWRPFFFLKASLTPVREWQKEWGSQYFSTFPPSLSVTLSLCLHPPSFPLSQFLSLHCRTLEWCSRLLYPHSLVAMPSILQNTQKHTICVQLVA